MKYAHKITCFAATSLLALTLITPAIAGNSNVISLVQVGSKNKLVSDQSAANQSKIGGVPLADALDSEGILNQSQLTKANLVENPASQTGDKNNAEINILKPGGYVYLSQSSSEGTNEGNTATITLNGADSFASIDQVGDNNEADIEVDGNLSGGSVLQNGSNNSGTVRVLSGAEGSSATLTQTGSNNLNYEIQANVSGENVEYEIIGNNTTQTSALIVNSIVGDVGVEIKQTILNFR